jgi:imidazolonepropionase-like amidohydrolase
VILLFSIAETYPQNYTQVPARPQDHPVALVGGTVHTVSGSVLENATILFENGKITAIGNNVTIPANAERLDISGKHVYPSLIDAYTTLGLVEIGAVRATRDLAEAGAVNPNVRAEVALNPDSELLPVARANGIALALTVPQGGIISGSSALIMLDGWTWEQMTLKTPVGLHVNWPWMTIRRAWWIRESEEEQRKQMNENLRKIRDTFAEARAYMKAKQAEQQKGVPYHDTDSRWEAMIPVLEKKVPVFVNANEIKQIQAAMQWAEDEDVKLVVVGGHDSWRVTDLLKTKDIPVVYGPVHDMPNRRWEAYDTPFTTPMKLQQAGVRFCIAGFEEPAHVRNLPYHAATAAAYGLPTEEALKAITLYSAQILGVDDRVGSIEVGKDATLIVTDGDPLEIKTQVLQEFIQGRKIDLGNKHRALYEKYSRKYQQLEMEKASQ